jgi:hypothetical protein
VFLSYCAFVSIYMLVYLLVHLPFYLFIPKMAADAQPFRACFQEVGPAMAHVAQYGLTTGYLLEHVLGVVRANNIGNDERRKSAPRRQVRHCVLCVLCVDPAFTSFFSSLRCALTNLLLPFLTSFTGISPAIR